MKIEYSAAEQAAQFIHDNVLGNYVAAVLATATAWTARQLYSWHQRRRDERREAAEN
ncbi:hypothetical protein [Streptomyces sp. NRRL S-87]|uniref:hypothetical protein n=1 Tax=Streptomyces sp. NRRL S-87 TaxID=1463920 RepID=UPI000AD7FAFD|nr:hypothetical protein [Streptomyces sp. NRRL S-87]